jgi:hypothetical protein
MPPSMRVGGRRERDGRQELLAGGAFTRRRDWTDRTVEIMHPGRVGVKWARAQMQPTHCVRLIAALGPTPRTLCPLPSTPPRRTRARRKARQAPGPSPTTCRADGSRLSSASPYSPCGSSVSSSSPSHSAEHRGIIVLNSAQANTSRVRSPCQYIAKVLPAERRLYGLYEGSKGRNCDRAKYSVCIQRLIETTAPNSLRRDAEIDNLKTWCT